MQNKPQNAGPTKQQIRDYTTMRAQSKASPPTNEEIRRMLGWELVAASRENRL